MKDFRNEYRQKLRSPEEAVAVVKDGDWIDYTSCLGKPILLDRALAKRRDELHECENPWEFDGGTNCGGRMR